LAKAERVALGPLDVEALKDRLLSAGGGSEAVQHWPGLRLRVYALVAPEPDRQQPHEEDEVYLVLEGGGVLVVEGERMPLRAGQAAYVPARVEHHFEEYDRIALLVIFWPSI
jgi:mannose-6-phosphate isomerase-like protein (cupin superfamily)